MLATAVPRDGARWVAQRIEHLTTDQEVAGSNPAERTQVCRSDGTTAPAGLMSLQQGHAPTTITSPGDALPDHGGDLQLLRGLFGGGAARPRSTAQLRSRSIRPGHSPAAPAGAGSMARGCTHAEKAEVARHEVAQWDRGHEQRRGSAGRSGATAPARRRRRGRIAGRGPACGGGPRVPPGRHGGCGLLDRDGADRPRRRVGARRRAVHAVHRPTATLGRGACGLHGAVRGAGAPGTELGGGGTRVGLAAGSVGPGGVGVGSRQAESAQPEQSVAAEPPVGRSGNPRRRRSVRDDRRVDSTRGRHAWPAG